MIYENVGHLVLFNFHEDAHIFHYETNHVAGDVDLSKDEVIEVLGRKISEFEIESGNEIVWAQAIVIPLSDPKSTWRVTYSNNEEMPQEAALNS